MSERSRFRAVRRWPLLWLATSALLVLWAAQSEYGVAVASIYIGTNAVSLGVVWLTDPRPPPQVLRRYGTAVALQLPVFVVVVVMYAGETTRPRVRRWPLPERPPERGPDPPVG